MIQAVSELRAAVALDRDEGGDYPGELSSLTFKKNVALMLTTNHPTGALAMYTRAIASFKRSELSESSHAHRAFAQRLVMPTCYRTNQLLSNLSNVYDHPFQNAELY